MPITPNATATDLAIMQAMVATITAGTVLAQNSGPVYIQNRYGLSTGAFPALHLAVGPQKRRRNSNRAYAGQTTIYADYYDRWDTQTLTQDQIRADIAADLERIAANLEHNDETEWQGLVYTISIAEYSLSDYDGMFDSTLIPGLTLIFRRLMVTFNILPYYVP